MAQSHLNYLHIPPYLDLKTWGATRLWPTSAKLQRLCTLVGKRPCWYLCWPSGVIITDVTVKCSHMFPWRQGLLIDLHGVRWLKGRMPTSQASQVNAQSLNVRVWLLEPIRKTEMSFGIQNHQNLTASQYCSGIPTGSLPKHWAARRWGCLVSTSLPEASSGQ